MANEEGDGRKRKGRRKRFQTAADAERQLREITAARNAARKGEIDAVIDSIEKSEQRERNSRARIRTINDALEDYG